MERRTRSVDCFSLPRDMQTWELPVGVWLMFTPTGRWARLTRKQLLPRGFWRLTIEQAGKQYTLKTYCDTYWKVCDLYAETQGC